MLQEAMSDTPQLFTSLVNGYTFDFNARGFTTATLPWTTVNMTYISAQDQELLLQPYNAADSPNGQSNIDDHLYTQLLVWTTIFLNNEPANITRRQQARLILRSLM